MKRGLVFLISLGILWGCSTKELEPTPTTPNTPTVPEIPDTPDTPEVPTDPEEPTEPEEPTDTTIRKIRVGVFGDSISTYEGYLYSTDANAVWYPTRCTSPISGCTVLDNVNQTYWHQLIYQKQTGAELDVNSSWQGTKVVSSTNSFLARYNQFNDPDVIIIHGGTNDKNQSSPIGTIDYTLPTSYLSEAHFAQAYIKTIKLLVTRYPGVNLILIIGDMLKDTNYATTIKSIAAHYKLPCVDFTDVTLKKCQGSHPDVTGHKDMADRIWSETQQHFKYKDSSNDARFFSEEITPDALEGQGTQASPYLLNSVCDLKQMNAVMTAGSTTYFKMTDNIDMDSITEWSPLNSNSPYDKAIDFDGNGKTLSNFSYSSSGWCGFFAVVNGKVRNLTIKNASITASGNCAGILGAWMGANNGVSAQVENVKIDGGSITMKGTSQVGSFCGQAGYDCSLVNCHSSANVSGSKSSACGGLVGSAAYSMSFDRCSYKGILSGSRYSGGIVAILKTRSDGTTSHIKNCFTSGTISAGQQTGGIVGDLYENAVVQYCISTAKITGQFSFGGIVGRAANGKSTANDTNNNNTIEACIAWNPNIITNLTSYVTDKYSSGAIVGFTGTQNTLKNCWRRADMIFQDCLSVNVLIDQQNSSSSQPLVTKNTDTHPYNYPYHGKAAASSANLASVATSLGYSTDIWAIQENTPKLK